MKERSKPYFWVTWLTGLLAGENSCEWAAWMKGHYEKIPKQPRDDGFDSAQWNAAHTALLNELRAEYAPDAKLLLVEDQTSWRIDGKTATIAGKMDLISVRPNIVIDAKSGRPKNSHVLQIQIYLLAIEINRVAAIPPSDAARGFSGVLRYADGTSTDVPDVDLAFRERLFELLRRLGAPEPPAPTPSRRECKFCDVSVCTVRDTSEEAPIEIVTDQF